MREIKIEISKRLVNGVYEIRVNGITSGCVIHFGDGDSGSIVFGYDAARFNPSIKLVR